MRRIENVKALRSLFDLLPDVYYFVKDRQGRFVTANGPFAELCGVSKPADMVGQTDWDFFPPDRASLYVQDDRRVITTGQPMLHRVEPAPKALLGRRFVVTSKIPLFDARQRVVGLAGIARDLNRSEQALRSFEAFERTVAYIEAHYHEPVTIPQLARLEGMSTSRFERHFKRTFQTTPIDYITQIRIRHASRLLVTTTTPIVEIALQCGFYDHSHFTRHFKKALGVSPLRYRKTHESGESTLS